MSKPKKVVWTKGMFLMPQHFQAQDDYFEQALHFRAATSNFANWGLSRLGVDEASLVNGLFTLRHCEGIFPDGLAFQAPLVDELPAGRQIKDVFSVANRPHLDIYLAVPEARPSTRNYVVPSGSASPNGMFRYTAELRSQVDATLGADEKVIQVAAKSLRILLEGENLEGFTPLRIARVTQGTGGTYQLSDEFIPPLVDILASDYLMMLTRRQIEILTAKSSSLSMSRRQKDGNLADFTNSEAADFWFLHTVNSYLPDLIHIWKVRRGHPEILFRTMLSLAGALTTFALNESVRDLPEYDHDVLGESFTKLDTRIRALVEIVRKSKCIAIPLRPVERFIWSGSLTDERQLDAAQFIISVSATIAVDELIAKFPRLARVSAPDELSRIIRAALSGVSLRHLTNVPASVPLNLSCQYFAMTASGAHWEQILQARALSVFVPGEISDPKMELLTVLK